jgi:hypothetical protein
MNLSRDTLIDWLESLREYNATAIQQAWKTARILTLEAENRDLETAITALVNGEACGVEAVAPPVQPPIVYPTSPE